MLICAFGSLLSAVVVSYFVTKVASTFSRDLRKDIFGKVLSFSMEEIKNFSTSSLITRTTNDITQVQMLIAMGMQMLIKAPIMAVWAIMKIYGKGFEWSVITAGAVGILLIMKPYIKRKPNRNKSSKSLQCREVSRRKVCKCK